MYKFIKLLDYITLGIRGRKHWDFITSHDHDMIIITTHMKKKMGGVAKPLEHHDIPFRQVGNDLE